MPFLLPRRDFLAATAAAALGGRVVDRLQGVRPTPTKEQILWHQDELALFAHFGINTFTDREWGDGTEDPRLFDPTAFDARQWTRAAKAAGFKTLVLTAKHHDGFCLWPTATTKHSVAASPFRGGRGDVVREVADACKADGLRLGLYLSPWDRNAPLYGNTGYSGFYCEQLTELLTRYGPVHEVWFDGANGEGPSGKRQVYDWPRYWSMVKIHQPRALIFSDAGPDLRWIGNENGVAGETNWATVRPEVVPFPGTTGAAATRMLQQGDPDGSVWRPGETDVSIRPGWFWHPDQDTRVRSTENLVRLYDTSVGRNSKLLLNVPPTTAGLLHETDVANLAAMRRALDSRAAVNLTPRGSMQWGSTGPRSAAGHCDFGRDVTVGMVVLTEAIALGQLIAKWHVEGLAGGSWRTLAGGTTVGNKRIVTFDPVVCREVRVVLDDAIARMIIPPGVEMYAAG